MRSNPLERFIVRLSKIESRIAGTSESQQPVGKYSDDMHEEIDLYLDGIEKGLDDHEATKASNTSNPTVPTEMMNQIVNQLSVLTEAVGDGETRERKRKEDVEKIIEGVSKALPENAKEIVTDSYEKSMGMLDKARKVLSGGFKLEDPNGYISRIEEFNTNMNDLKSHKIEEGVEQAANRGAKKGFEAVAENALAKFREDVKGLKNIHALSEVAAFVAGAILALSIFNCYGANEREQEAEEKILQANEKMEAASKHLNFNLWVMKNYPFLKDDFLKENPDASAEKKH